jgi:hypothetical protein
MSNARAERRRAKKQKQADIELSNPVSHHFAAFIAGNAQHCDEVVTEKTAVGQHLVLCGAGPSLAEHAAEWCPQGDQVWGCNSAAPWLHAHGHKLTHAFTVDQTTHMVKEWYTPMPGVEYLIASTVHPHLVEHLISHGCKLRWFHNFVGIKGAPVLYGVCNACGSVVEEGFQAAPDCHDAAVGPLTERMAAFREAWAASGRYQEEDYAALRDFAAGLNIYMGLLSYEDWLYQSLYPPMIRAGSGLNSVNRALDIALCMGFSKITMLGADCCLKLRSRPPVGVPNSHPDYLRWLEHETIMHADGGSATASGATSLTMGGELDGRYWETKVDMVISAVWLVKAKKQLKDRLQLIGDTLPNALMNKGEKFLARLPSMTYSDGTPVPINLADDPVYADL